MTPAEIRFALDVIGSTQRDVAATIDVTDAMVSMVIAGQRRAARVRRAIAAAIARPYSEVWGEEDPDPDGALTGGEELHKAAPRTPTASSGGEGAGGRPVSPPSPSTLEHQP